MAYFIGEDVTMRTLIRKVVGTDVNVSAVRPNTRSRLAEVQNVSTRRRSTTRANRSVHGDTPSLVLRNKIKEKVRRSAGVTGSVMKIFPATVVTAKRPADAPLMNLDDPDTPRTILSNLKLTESKVALPVTKMQQVGTKKPQSEARRQTSQNSSESSLSDVPGSVFETTATRRKRKMAPSIGQFERGVDERLRQRHRGGEVVRQVQEPSRNISTFSDSSDMMRSFKLGLDSLSEPESVEKKGLARRPKKHRIISQENFERGVEQNLQQLKGKYWLRQEQGHSKDISALSDSSGLIRSFRLGPDTLLEPESVQKKGLARRPKKHRIISQENFEGEVEQNFQQLKGSQECYIDPSFSSEDRSRFGTGQTTNNTDIVLSNTALYAPPLHDNRNLQGSSPSKSLKSRSCSLYRQEVKDTSREPVLYSDIDKAEVVSMVESEKQLALNVDEEHDVSMEDEVEEQVDNGSGKYDGSMEEEDQQMEANKDTPSKTVSMENMEFEYVDRMAVSSKKVTRSLSSTNKLNEYSEGVTFGKNLSGVDELGHSVFQSSATAKNESGNYGAMSPMRSTPSSQKLMLETGLSALRVSLVRYTVDDLLKSRRSIQLIGDKFDMTTKKDGQHTEEHGETASEDVEQGEATSEDVEHEEAASEDVEHEEAASQDVEHEEAASQDVEHEETASQDVEHEEPAEHEEAVSEDSEHEEAASEDVEHEEAASEDVEHEEAASQDVEHEEAASQDVEHEESASQDVEHEETASQDVEHEEPAEHEEAVSEDSEHEEAASEESEHEEAASEESEHEEAASEQVEEQESAFVDTGEEGNLEDEEAEEPASMEADLEDPTSEEESVEEFTPEEEKLRELTHEEEQVEEEATFEEGNEMKELYQEEEEIGELTPKEEVEEETSEEVVAMEMADSDVEMEKETSEEREISEEEQTNKTELQIPKATTTQMSESKGSQIASPGFPPTPRNFNRRSGSISTPRTERSANKEGHQIAASPLENNKRRAQSLLSRDVLQDEGEQMVIAGGSVRKGSRISSPALPSTPKHLIRRSGPLSASLTERSTTKEGDQIAGSSLGKIKRTAQSGQSTDVSQDEDDDQLVNAAGSVRKGSRISSPAFPLTPGSLSRRSGPLSAPRSEHLSTKGLDQISALDLSTWSGKAQSGQRRDLFQDKQEEQVMNAGGSVSKGSLLSSRSFKSTPNNLSRRSGATSNLQHELTAGKRGGQSSMDILKVKRSVQSWNSSDESQDEEQMMNAGGSRSKGAQIASRSIALSTNAQNKRSVSVLTSRNERSGAKKGDWSRGESRASIGRSDVMQDEEQCTDSEGSNSEELTLEKEDFLRVKKNVLSTTLTTPHYFKTSGAKFPKKRPIAKRAPRKTDKAPLKKNPALPSSFVKETFAHYAKVPVAKDSYRVVEQCVNVYFKQMIDDLEAFASHAGRKIVNASDIELLLRRQGLVTDNMPMHVLIERHLPMDYRKLLIPIATSGNKVVLK